MAILKTKDIRRMSKSERDKKFEELKFELVKAKVSASKSGSSKIKEIKKTMARILTLNNFKENKSSKEVEKNK
ncbi:MAG: 50S ribosomal protein L29 [Candidatus Pacearchaeota archaeon]|nr:50S ribosomal protein L29 [Candidatus Pacearchaeota archaeon]